LLNDIALPPGLCVSYPGINEANHSR
jgi:hypothetical protein